MQAASLRVGTITLRRWPSGPVFSGFESLVIVKGGLVYALEMERRITVQIALI